MNPTASIIVPVYNAQDYIKRCVDSILCQEYTDFELLFIDDGSTDASGQLLDTYASKDSRIRVFHQKNQGVSASRNYALEQAQGTYIQFLDSDDWITPDATKLLIRTAMEKQCDMVITDFYRVDGKRLSQKGDIDTDEIMDRQEFAAHMIENPADFYYGVLWNKLYRRSIIEEHQLRMDTSISWCEDFLFNLEYMRYANAFCALQAPVYYYVKRKGSLVSQGMSIGNTIKMKINVFEYYNEFYKNIYEEKDYDEIRMQIYRFFVTSAKDGTVQSGLLSGSTRLGKERKSIPNPTALAVDGQVLDQYRFHKLLEYHLESNATANNLTLDETHLLLLIHDFSDTNSMANLSELSDLSGMTQRKIASLLQRLIKRDYILVETRKRGRRYYGLTLLAANMISRLDISYQDFDRQRFRDFSNAEQNTYQQLSTRMNRNIKDALSSIRAH